MNPNQALWEKGDFKRIALTMRSSGEALVSLGATRGMKVLDLGCDDGTTALPAAQLGAEVRTSRRFPRPTHRRFPPTFKGRQP